MNIKFLKELFNELKNNRLKFDKALKNQNELLKKINEVKMGRKTPEQEEVINNLDEFYNSRENGISFFRDYGKMILDAGYKAKQNKTTGTGLKILTPKQMLQRFQ